MPEDQPLETPLTDAELDAKLTDPSVIWAGLKGSKDDEFGVRVLTQFKQLSQGVAIRDQTQVGDRQTAAELEFVMLGRVLSNTCRAFTNPEDAAAWLALRLVNAHAVSVAGAHLQAQTMIGRMLDPSTEDSEHSGKLADALLKELDLQHPENPQARKQLVLRALDVARRREESKPKDDDKGHGLYL